MFTRKFLKGPVCPTCGYPVPAWMKDPEGEKALEAADRFLEKHPGSSTSRVAAGIGRPRGFTYSLLSTLYREGMARPVLQPDASGRRTRLWLPLVSENRT